MENTDYAGRYITIAREYHRRLDAAVRDTLVEIKGKGVVPPCGPGCSSCCRLPLSATVPEAMLAARHIIKTLNNGEADGLVKKITAWLSWRKDELPGLADGGMDLMQAHMLHGPACPMLSDGLCAIYPVRPMGCRVHFSYDEKTCRPSARPGALFDSSAQVVEILEAVKPLCMEYRHTLEGTGTVFADLVGQMPMLVLRELEKS